MKVFLDNNLPKRLRNRFSPAVSVVHTSEKGTQNLTNGELIAYISDEFDVLITIDKNMPFQTKLNPTSVAVLILDLPDNSLVTIEPHVDAIELAVKNLKAGSYYVFKTSGETLTLSE